MCEVGLTRPEQTSLTLGLMSCCFLKMCVMARFSLEQIVGAVSVNASANRVEDKASS